MFKKRGQRLSVTTIVIAVIALIVLVVLIVIFTGRLGLFSIGIKERGTCSEVCVALGYEYGSKTTTGTPPTPGAVDSDSDQCACISFPV